MSDTKPTYEDMQLRVAGLKTTAEQRWEACLVNQVHRWDYRGRNKYNAEGRTKTLRIMRNKSHDLIHETELAERQIEALPEGKKGTDHAVRLWKLKCTLLWGVRRANTLARAVWACYDLELSRVLGGES